MEAIQQFLNEFDLGSLLPKLDSLMDNIAVLLRIVVLAGPALLLFLGLWYFLLPPREANHYVGYRFFWGMSSVEAWLFMQKLAGILWSLLGLVLGTVFLLLSRSFPQMDLMDMVAKVVLYLFWELGLVLISCALIDITVLIAFDSRGILRKEKRLIRALDKAILRGEIPDEFLDEELEEDVNEISQAIEAQLESQEDFSQDDSEEPAEPAEGETPAKKGFTLPAIDLTGLKAKALELTARFQKKPAEELPAEDSLEEDVAAEPGEEETPAEESLQDPAEEAPAEAVLCGGIQPEDVPKAEEAAEEEEEDTAAEPAQESPPAQPAPKKGWRLFFKKPAPKEEPAQVLEADELSEAAAPAEDAAPAQEDAPAEEPVEEE